MWLVGIRIILKVIGSSLDSFNGKQIAARVCKEAVKESRLR